MRHDTADLRLTDYGRQVGLIDDARYERFRRKRDAIHGAIERLSDERPERGAMLATFARLGRKPPEGRPTAAEFLARPEFSWGALEEMGIGSADLTPEQTEQVYLHFRYAGYLRKEAQQVERFRRLEGKRIPDGFDRGAAWKGFYTCDCRRPAPDNRRGFLSLMQWSASTHRGDRGRPYI